MRDLVRSTRPLLALVALLGACDLDDKDDRDPEPDAQLVDGAIIFDAASTDASTFCSSCGADEICVQFFNGTCNSFRVECQPRNAACPVNACTQGCMQWQCNAGNEMHFFRCDTSACGGEVPGGFYCYGP